MKRVLVTGAGGFIGGHLSQKLQELGYWVRGVDIKAPQFRKIHFDDWLYGDLRDYSQCLKACRGIDTVFNLAADMGGIGYIGTVTASISRNNILISSNMLQAAYERVVDKFFFSSSACIYPAYRQDKPDLQNLKESDAWPAEPEPGYGLEKLFTEKLCEYFMHDFGMLTYVARFHNVYGPYGTYDGGREKAPAALCRKIVKAYNGEDLVIWGDGQQTRSFLYVDDCVDGVLRLINSECHQPLNIGSDRLVTIIDLADIICANAGKKLHYAFDVNSPQGVRGRCSDNTLVKQVLDWEPKVSLEEGLAKTYDWIAEQILHGK